MDIPWYSYPYEKLEAKELRRVSNHMIGQLFALIWVNDKRPYHVTTDDSGRESLQNHATYLVCESITLRGSANCILQCIRPTTDSGLNIIYEASLSGWSLLLTWFLLGSYSQEIWNIAMSVWNIPRYMRWCWMVPGTLGTHHPRIGFREQMPKLPYLGGQNLAALLLGLGPNRKAWFPNAWNIFVWMSMLGIPIIVFQNFTLTYYNIL